MSELILAGALITLALTFALVADWLHYTANKGKDY